GGDHRIDLAEHGVGTLLEAGWLCRGLLHGRHVGEGRGLGGTERRFGKDGQAQNLEDQGRQTESQSHGTPGAWVLPSHDDGWVMTRGAARTQVGPSFESSSPDLACRRRICKGAPDPKLLGNQTFVPGSCTSYAGSATHPGRPGKSCGEETEMGLKGKMGDRIDAVGDTLGEIKEKIPGMGKRKTSSARKTSGASKASGTAAKKTGTSRKGTTAKRTTANRAGSARKDADARKSTASESSDSPGKSTGS